MQGKQSKVIDRPILPVSSKGYIIIIHVDIVILRPNQRGSVVFFVYIPRHKCYGIVERRLET